jgi:Zn-dependent peptidase ImmA (M78 family)
VADGRHVLQRILDIADLDQAACARALGLSPQLFSEMLAGQRDIPDSMLPLIAAVVGVHESVLSSPNKLTRNADVVPAIWYKLRGGGLTQSDRAYVLALRQLAFYQHELESVTESRSAGWKVLFEAVRSQIDPQASPSEQGRQAARIFRKQSGLDVGARGIGEVFRGCLRNNGILVIETPAPDSVLDGCSFYVGPSGEMRPCVFANSYRTTWFRRNRILMHELAHAIFDVESAIASLDLKECSSSDDVQENRADAFAQGALVPPEVLRHVGQRLGIRWQEINDLKFAALMAETQVEQRLLANAMLEAQLVDGDVAAYLEQVDIAAELRRLTDRALSTEEYMQAHSEYRDAITKRATTLAPRKLLLPFRYVDAVKRAAESQTISRGKAAKMLMIERSEFDERFPEEESAFAD